MIGYKKDSDNIVTLILDMKDRDKNILNHKVSKVFVPIIKQLEKEKAEGNLRGVIITSAKKGFVSGGDLEYLSTNSDPEVIFKYTEELKLFFRALEKPGVPVVAALNGTALATGFELALACHYRIAVDNPKVRFGHPEVEVGIMPGGGSVTRLMWLLGIERAFHILSTGERFPPKKALEIGIIDEIARDQEQMLEFAKKWLLKTKEGRRPWDVPGSKIPGGSANDLKIARKIRNLATNLSQSTRNNFDAPAVILQSLAEGSKVDFDTASRIESRGFTRLVISNKARNMMKAFWFDTNDIRLGKNRPKGFGKFRPRKVGIIGSGRMGSGIALSCMRRGMDVVIKDVSNSVAEKGKHYIVEALKLLVKEGSLADTEYDQYLAKITTTEKASDFENCDIVIEAVFENENVKNKVILEAESILDEYSIVATNTSSIPISQLAKKVKRPENFVGIHFFPPAEQVPLVEVVRGKNTSEETVARAIDFVKKIHKVPIVTKDSWGFFAARVRNTYLLEGIELLREGYPAALIENLGFQLGMPKGPLATTDEIGLEMALRYETQAGMLFGPKYIQHPATAILNTMINGLGRNGKSSGFYNYYGGVRLELWEDLKEHFPEKKDNWDLLELQRRMLFVQILEASWCMQEHVIDSEAEANLGSIYGWGFPSQTGGVLQYIKDYGYKKFVTQCKAFEKVHGPRFKVPKYILKEIEE